MSTAENELPAEPREPVKVQEDEVSKHDQEDPDFAEIQARARAKARGEVYNPDIHGPFDRKLTPRLQRVAERATRPPESIQGIISRFKARAQPRLQLMDRKRKDLE